jgi:hypothetical protein
MSAQARGRGTVRQRADDQPIAGCARALVARGERMHAAQQRPEIGLNRRLALAYSLHGGAGAKLQPKFVLVRRLRRGVVCGRARKARRGSGVSCGEGVSAFAGRVIGIVVTGVAVTPAFVSADCGGTGGALADRLEG